MRRSASANVDSTASPDFVKRDSIRTEAGLLALAPSENATLRVGTVFYVRNTPKLQLKQSQFY